MTNLTRRSFIKGLMALAGVAAVGLPAVVPNADVVIAEVEQFLAATPEAAQPIGVFGSVRIDQTWYALHDGALNAMRETVPLESDDDVVSAFSRIVGWDATCVIDRKPSLTLHADGGAHDLMFSLGNHSWFGQARLQYVAPVWLPTGNPGLSLDFSGIEGLTLVKHA